MLSGSRFLRGFSQVQRRLFCKGRPCQAKDIRFGDPVRAQLLQGVEILSAAVGLTLGPKGRTVALEQYKSEPKITKDGFTVARAIDLRDSFQNIGAKLVVDVAENTNKKAGDGTSTATVLACSIARLAMDSIKKGCSPAEIRQGIMLGATTAVEHLKRMSKQVTTPEEIKQVAVISANGDEHVGNLISTAMEKVGKHGIVTVKEGTTLHDEVEVINGLEIEHGYISPYFINSKTGCKVELTNCFILYCDFKVNDIRDIVPALEICVSMNKPLLIVAEDIEGDALTTLVINKMRNNLSVCAVKSPSFGEGRSESLKDLAAATGGRVFGDESDIEIRDVKVEHFGKADEVSITNEETLILKGKGDPEEIAKRAAQIDYLISKAKNEFIRDGLHERKARLVSSVAVIKIGGDSMLDVNERKDRVTDSLNATKAAVEEGIVPGGGTALLRCIRALHSIKAASKSQAQGIAIVKKALETPCYTIAFNAGVDAANVVAKVLSAEGNIGYDAMNGTFVDMLAEGIIDPTKVVRTALTDAAGVASLLTAAEVVITNLREPKASKDPPGDQGDVDDYDSGFMEENAVVLRYWRALSRRLRPLHQAIKPAVTRLSLNPNIAQRSTQ